MIKHLLTSAAAVLTWANAMTAANDFSEDFNTLTGKYQSTSSVTLPSGQWTMSGVEANSSNGAKSVKFSANNGYVITPAIDNPDKIGFTYRSGGSNKTVTVSYSTDNGSSWTTLDEFKIASSSSAFTSYSKSAALARPLASNSR